MKQIGKFREKEGSLKRQLQQRVKKSTAVKDNLSRGGGNVAIFLKGLEAYWLL